MEDGPRGSPRIRITMRMMEVKTIIAATLISRYFQYSISPKGRAVRKRGEISAVGPSVREPGQALAEDGRRSAVSSQQSE